MIIEVRAKNCFIFSEMVTFSLKADMRNKKLSSNVHKENNFNIIKVAGIYGPNNSGKTCLLKCIRSIRNVLQNKDIDVMTNLFLKNNVSELGVTFLNDGRKFDYEFKYNSKNDEFIYEKFKEIEKDENGNEKEKIYLIRDSENEQYYCIDQDGVTSMLKMMAKNNILIFLLDTEPFHYLNEMKIHLTSFAQKIDIVDMNNIPIAKTIEVMKNQSSLQRNVVKFIKNADLDLDSIEYVPDLRLPDFVNDTNKPEEKVLDSFEYLMDHLKLMSVYDGVHLPTLFFDSTGTKKIVALASYAIEALEKGRILLIDELDSSLHFTLTRAIVSMFNNELNLNAQLIFTVHDINLMDCQRLFRKEQIWFVYKERENKKHNVYLYSLASFTANDGVRDTSDIIGKYKKGLFGALPEPELIKSLLDIDSRRMDKTDE